MDLSFCILGAQHRGLFFSAVGTEDIVIGGSVVGGTIGFDLLNRLTNSLVRLTRHDEKLSQQDQDWDNEVEQEEFLRAECTLRSLVDEAVDKEDGARGVNGAG